MSIRSYLLFAFIVFTVISTVRSDRYKTMVVGGGDSWGYYTYLPAVLQYGDLATLQSCIAVRKTYDQYSVREDQTGVLRVTEAPKHDQYNIMKYTYGVAVFLTPAYLVAHAIASISDSYVADGYSPIYILMLYLIIIVYVTIGFYYLGRYLDYYVSPWVSNLTIASLAFATNLLYFVTINNVMSHPIQFMLWALLLYHSHRYFKEGRSMISLVGMALSIGFICIIRPVELFCVLIPLVYSLAEAPSGKTMLQELFSAKYIKHVLVAIGIGLLILLPQVIYWYTLTGDLVYDSYPDEKFDFTNPQILAGLFSFKNGFFSYSPIMLLGMIGIIIGLWREKKLMVVTLIMFVLHTYISYSWWCWNYINGFGSRIMVDILPILALPLAYFIAKISKWWRWSYLFILIPFVALNFMHTWQKHKGIIFTEFGSLDFMRQTFGATTHELEHSVAFDLAMYQYDDYTDGVVVYSNDFESNDTLAAIEYLESEGSQYYAVTDSVSQDFSTIQIPNSTLLKNGEYQHLKIDLDLFIAQQVSDIWSSTVIHISYKKDGEVLDSKNLRLCNKTGEGTERSFWWGKTGVTSHVVAYLEPNNALKDGGDVNVLFYKPQGTPVLYVDNLQIRVCVR